MVLKPTTTLLLILLSFFSAAIHGYHHHHNDKHNNNNNDHLNSSSGNLLAGIRMPEHPSFNAVSSSDCTLASPSLKDPEATIPPTVDDDDEEEDQEEDEDASRFIESLKLSVRHRSPNLEREAKHTVIESAARDLIRIQTLHRRIAEGKNQNAAARQTHRQERRAKPSAAESTISGHLMATLGSGVSHGSGEYFMDVFVGTPPKHFSLILDTGSDLNWIQCLPCYDCFEQSGPHYDPKESSSYRTIGCRDSRCGLVSAPESPRTCAGDNQSCPYYYWYGDSSNTTGDFALETFTVNLTGSTEHRRVENVMFGCGHWNRGLFHGAAGLLGLGRGPLSFASQLQSLYGHSFSYCLVDRNSNTNVRSKLIFGEDNSLLAHPDLNFTALVAGKENPVDTFYYVGIESIWVGGERLDIPAETWNLTAEDGGGGGTIVDSGTTLSYFAEPAYEVIREAFVKKVKGYAMVEEFPVLSPCYNVSGVVEKEKPELPEFAIRFRDGAVWNFPVENYFIRLPQEEILCLAILNTTRSSLSIIGNYQQQNFHVLYDTKRSRLGFAPTKCAHL